VLNKIILLNSLYLGELPKQMIYQGMIIVIPHFLTSYFLFTRLLNPFYPIIFSTFYSLFHRILSVYFPTFYLFISQHFICLFCKHFTRLFLSFYPFKSQLFTNILSVYFSTFHFYFLIFTRLLKLRSFVVLVKISAERYFKIPHFSSEGTILSFIIFSFTI